MDNVQAWRRHRRMFLGPPEPSTTSARTQSPTRRPNTWRRSLRPRSFNCRFQRDPLGRSMRESLKNALPIPPPAGFIPWGGIALEVVRRRQFFRLLLISFPPSLHKHITPFWRSHTARKERHGGYQSVGYGCHNQDQKIYLQEEQRVGVACGSALWTAMQISVAIASPMHNALLWELLYT
jgi:hypothetical protein